MDRTRSKSGWRERWTVGWAWRGGVSDAGEGTSEGVGVERGGSSTVTVPEKRSRVMERETGRTAKRGRGKFMTTRVETERTTVSVYSRSSSTRCKAHHQHTSLPRTAKGTHHTLAAHTAWPYPRIRQRRKPLSQLDLINLDIIQPDHPVRPAVFISIARAEPTSPIQRFLDKMSRAAAGMIRCERSVGGDELSEEDVEPVE